MTEGVLLEDADNEDWWCCDEDGCNALNSPENSHCCECEKKRRPDPPYPPGWEDEN